MKEGEKEEEGGEKEEEANRKKRERRERSLSAQTAAPRSIFDYHIIETVFTKMCVFMCVCSCVCSCVCVCVCLQNHHSSFRLCDISCVAYIL